MDTGDQYRDLGVGHELDGIVPARLDQRLLSNPVRRMIGSSSCIFVLSGESGAGKTALCLQTVELLRQAGVQPAGLVSPARFEDGCKVEIMARDIRSGEQRQLAERNARDRESAGCGWRFEPAALQWGDEILKSATPCDVLMIDELGSLELKHNKGWMTAWTILKAHHFQAAVIVVRPSLLDLLRKRLPGGALEIVTVTPGFPTDETFAEDILSCVVREIK
ncbi:MAG: nucleoside-triphosphatase [Lentisphaerota bacterium]